MATKRKRRRKEDQETFGEWMSRERRRKNTTWYDFTLSEHDLQMKFNLKDEIAPSIIQCWAAKGTSDPDHIRQDALAALLICRYKLSTKQFRLVNNLSMRKDAVPIRSWPRRPDLFRSCLPEIFEPVSDDVAFEAIVEEAMADEKEDEIDEKTGAVETAKSEGSSLTGKKEDNLRQKPDNYFPPFSLEEVEHVKVGGELGDTAALNNDECYEIGDGVTGSSEPAALRVWESKNAAGISLFEDSDNSEFMDLNPLGACKRVKAPKQSVNVAKELEVALSEENVEGSPEQTEIEMNRSIPTTAVDFLQYILNTRPNSSVATKSRESRTSLSKVKAARLTIKLLEDGEPPLDLNTFLSALQIPECRKTRLGSDYMRSVEQTVNLAESICSRLPDELPYPSSHDKA